ncbi:hypothetical protein PCL_07384 [Purpureocillium lilacinum]|uniref:Reverse transcriptase n=1 Tax=Purpureocillium lilacinum TaxID=33203 RepID=A0A2U3DS70_PURLI|nr:hypothetical protein PCL_07384 [Purpureocillium lilacinum]
MSSSLRLGVRGDRTLAGTDWHRGRTWASQLRRTRFETWVSTSSRSVGTWADEAGQAKAPAFGTLGLVGHCDELAVLRVALACGGREAAGRRLLAGILLWIWLLTWKEAANVLARLRTGMARLNDYLHRIKATASQQCACGHARETLDHFLFRCTGATAFRTEMIQYTDTQLWNIPFYLGRKQRSDNDNGAPNMELVQAMIRYALATGRLENKRQCRVLAGPAIHY